MQTLLHHGNMMNLVALCLCEVSWTKLIVALKNPTGLGGNGLTGPFTQEVLRVAPKQMEGGEYDTRVDEKLTFAGFSGPDQSYQDPNAPP